MIILGNKNQLGCMLVLIDISYTQFMLGILLTLFMLGLNLTVGRTHLNEPSTTKKFCKVLPTFSLVIVNKSTYKIFHMPNVIFLQKGYS